MSDRILPVLRDTAITIGSIGTLGSVIPALTTIAFFNLYKKAVNDYSFRSLPPNQIGRINTLIEKTHEIIKVRINRGEDLDTTEYEDNQIDYLGQFADRVLFDISNISQEKLIYHQAYFLSEAFFSHLDESKVFETLNLIESLSYQDLLIISLFVRNNGEENKFGLRTENHYNEKITLAEVRCYHSVLQLYKRGYLSQLGFGGTMIESYKDISPRDLTSNIISSELYRILNLSEINSSELKGYIELLK